MSNEALSVPGLSGLTDFEYYRQQFENEQRQQSAEAEAIFDETVFQDALADPRTVSLELDVDGRHRVLPLLTPLESIEFFGVPWFNLDYHRRYAGGRPLWHFGHMSLLASENPRAYLDTMLPALQRLAESKAVMVLDHNAEEAPRIERELGLLATASAVTFEPIDGPEGRHTTHFHYASVAEHLSEGSESQGPQSLYDAFEDGIASGALEADGVTVSPTLSDDQIEQIWAFYEPVFNELSVNDPVAAGLTETEFRDLMQSPECVKFLYERDEEVINLCLLMNIKAAPWVNQSFYRQRFRKQYDQDLVYLSPGIITNPPHLGEAASLKTIGMVGKVFSLSGVEPVFSFACDTTSNDIHKVPQLSNAALLQNGIKSNFSEPPISRQLFSMLAVEHQ